MLGLKIHFCIILLGFHAPGIPLLNMSASPLGISACPTITQMQPLQVGAPDVDPLLAELRGFPFS